MEDGDLPVAHRGEVDALRKPGSQRDDLPHEGVVGDGAGDPAAHRVSDEHDLAGARRRGGIERGGRSDSSVRFGAKAAQSVSVAHYENFPVASRLIPAPLRPAVVAIYAFARAADDIADEGDAPPAARLARLDHFGAMLERIECGDVPAEEPFAALGAAIGRHALPLQPFRDLLSAFRQDVVQPRYAEFAQVLDYCSRSANPIGRLLLRLYRADDVEHCRLADAICTGLQLTNFWQDVASDWARGRVYLPLEDLAAFGVTLEAGHVILPLWHWQMLPSARPWSLEKITIVVSA